MYADGTGVNKNNAEAFRLFTLAANQDHVRAQTRLADMYMNNRVPLDNNNNNNNQQLGVEWYKKAASQGSISAMTSLAPCLESGTGIDRNLEEAIEWYEKAASGGDSCAAERLVCLVGYQGDGFNLSGSILFGYAARAA